MARLLLAVACLLAVAEGMWTPAVVADYKECRSNPQCKKPGEANRGAGCDGTESCGGKGCCVDGVNLDRFIYGYVKFCSVNIQVLPPPGPQPPT